ncbi:MAG TPA: GxGYxYP domain-containing protein [Streptosporangiaceae bacterium]|nr:GxGYxYP domain-containing protein [Streptosporangiaceae bacterium]
MNPIRPRSRRQFLATAAGATAGLAAAAAITRPALAESTAHPSPGTPTLAAGPALDVPAGLSWPAGQALPRFATPLRLAVADLTNAPSDEQLLLTTLQGVVNRRRPRIYLLQPQGEGLDTWLDALAVPHHQTAKPMSLLADYRDEVTGAVLYDPDVAGTINVATTLAGLHDAVATSAALAAGAGLPVIADLRGQFASDLDAYTWAAANLWPHTTHRMLVGLDPGISGYLRDYAVANRALVMFLDPSVAAELALLEQLMAGVPAGSPYLGWWPSDLTGESDGTQVASQYGLFVVATDYSANLSVFSGAHAPVSQARQRATVPPLGNKIYVTFTLTDGDNLQYDQHHMRQLWDDPSRGKVPLNWTVQPLAADAAPTFLAYYQRTATSNDYLMAGPSGAGYVYPGDWPADSLGIYTQMTRRYLDRTGMDTAVILNRSGGQDVYLDAATAQRYIDDVRPLGLLESWSSYTWTTDVAGTTPVSVSWQASSVAEAEQAIAAASAGWTGSTPLFLSIGMLAWNLTPTDVLTVAGSLSDDYVVVRADQYFALARKLALAPSGASLLGSAPTGQLDWQGPVQNGVGSIPGTLTTNVTTPQGASAVQWTETSAAPDSWIWVDPGAQLAAGNYYEVSVTVQGTGDVYLDFWNGQWDLTTGAVQLTAAPQALTLRAWVPEAADTHLQVRTAATGPVDLYASAASIRQLAAK